MVKVSAIVSAYQAQQFIRGRIDDLMNQTLYKTGELEIIVVNSASTDTTGLILEREYLPYITLIQTPFRESMYAAWNRAIKLAKGEYIVPANVDDRFKPDALSLMSGLLDGYHPSSCVVTCDSYVTDTPNAVWGSDYHISTEPPYTTGRLNFGHPYSNRMCEQCCVGNTPMWRKSVHEWAGYFDQSYLIAGDYEFFLRLWGLSIQRNEFIQMHPMFEGFGEPLGIFYFHPSTQGRTFAEQSAYESRRAILKWKPVIERVRA